MYFSTLAGVVHYYWLVKSDVREPLMYGAILLVLMLYRVKLWTTNKPQPVAVAPARAAAAPIRETL
jgi:sulfoxide reductase heme-binding subunit YedZ